MSTLFSARLRRLGVAQARINASGRVASAKITRLSVAFVRLYTVDVAIGAPSLDFGVASNSMYLGVI